MLLELGRIEKSWLQKIRRSFANIFGCVPDRSKKCVCVCFLICVRTFSLVSCNFIESWVPLEELLGFLGSVHRSPGGVWSEVGDQVSYISHTKDCNEKLTPICSRDFSKKQETIITNTYIFIYIYICIVYIYIYIYKEKNTKQKKEDAKHKEK